MDRRKPKVVEDPNPVDLGGGVVFDWVSFACSGSGNLALKGLSFAIGRGEKTGITP